MNEFINIHPFWSSPYVTAPSSIPRAVPTSFSIASLSTPASSVPNHPPPHHHVSSSSFVSPSSNASIVETNLSLSKYNAGILGLSRAFQDMDCGYYVNVEIFVGSRKIYSLIMLTYCPIFIEIVRTALRCSGVRLGLIRNLFLLP